MISHLLLNGLFGIFGGFVWALALNKQPNSGLIYGLVTGAIIGLFLYLISKASRVRANVTREEASFVMTMQSTLLLVTVVAMAVAVWVIRLIFF